MVAQAPTRLALEGYLVKMRFMTPLKSWLSAHRGGGLEAGACF